MVFVEFLRFPFDLVLQAGLKYDESNQELLEGVRK
jgi:hypothetical protein